MQEFTYKIVDNDTFSIVGYKGDEANVQVVTQGAREVSVIWDRLFRGHSEIQTITLPDTITDIGAYAFDGCNQLAEVKLPEGLLNMWQYAFARSGITTVNIPSTVRSVVPFTFEDCAQLTSVTMNPGTRKVFGNAFKGCTALKTVTAHKDTVIDPAAFAGCGDVQIIRTE